MNPQNVIALGQQGVEVMLLVGAPMLLVSLLIGLLVSVFQAATQLNEATLSFLPKLIAVLIVLVLAGPWMMQLLIDYMQRLYGSIPFVIG